MLKRVYIYFFIICSVLCCASVQAIDTAAPGNWTDTNTWVGGVVPGASDTVSILHAVTITNDVGTVGGGAWDGFTGNSSGSLTMNAGSLIVSALRWNSITSYTITNNSTLTFSGSHQNVKGTWLVDSSTLNGPPTFTFRSGGFPSITFRNGATGTFDNIQWYSGATLSITNEGSLNTLSANTLINSTEIGNFVFVMDNTDAAISTFNFTTLDLTLAAEWNLTVDVTRWNRGKGIFTLFDCTTLTGTFDNIQFIGGNYGPEAVIYDTGNGLITLDIRPESTVIMIK